MELMIGLLLVVIVVAIIIATTIIMDNLDEIQSNQRKILRKLDKLP